MRSEGTRGEIVLEKHLDENLFYQPGDFVIQLSVASNMYAGMYATRINGTLSDDAGNSIPFAILISPYGAHSMTLGRDTNSSPSVGSTFNSPRLATSDPGSGVQKFTLTRKGDLFSFNFLNGREDTQIGFTLPEFQGATSLKFGFVNPNCGISELSVRSLSGSEVGSGSGTRSGSNTTGQGRTPAPSTQGRSTPTRPNIVYPGTSRQ